MFEWTSIFQNYYRYCDNLLKDNILILFVIYVLIAMLPLLSLMVISILWKRNKNKYTQEGKKRFVIGVCLLSVSYVVFFLTPIPFGEIDELGLLLHYIFIACSMSSVAWWSILGTLLDRHKLDESAQDLSTD